MNSTIFKLSACHSATVKILHGVIDSNEIVKAGEVTTVHLCRTGRFSDPRYGDFELTLEMFQSIVNNFQSRVYGQDVQADISHNPSAGNVGPFERLFIQNDGLYGDIRWTQLGADKVNIDGYRYFSAEIHPNYTSNELDEQGKGQEFGPTMLGAAIVTRPCIKKLTKIGEVQLAEQSGADSSKSPLYLSESLQKQLYTETIAMWETFEAQLNLKLAQLKLSEEQRKTVKEQAKILLKQVTDKTEGQKSFDSIITMAEGLVEKESESNTPPSANDVVTLNEQQIKDAVVKALAEQETARNTQNAQHDALIALFESQIDKAEGLTDEIKIKLKENAKIVKANWDDEQVNSFAANQIAYGQQMAVTAQLSELGLLDTNAQGVVTLGSNNPGNNKITKLSETIESNLRSTAPFANKELFLVENSKLDPFVTKVLSEFDRIYASDLNNESIILSSGVSTNTSAVSVPRSYQRQVIKEALSDLTVLALVKTSVEPTSADIVTIYYSKRDVSQLMSQGYTYENQAMPRSAVGTDQTSAWLKPIKLIFDCSNEVLHFSAASSLNWNAWAENIAAAARAMREIIANKLANEMQRVADSYSATSNVDEDILALVNDDNKPVFAVANFPVVNPFQERNIRGEAIGDMENPITLKIDGNDIPQFDGSGKQVAGTYWTIVNLNMGYLSVVDNQGAPVTSNVSAATISYYHSTNVIKFNSDIPDGISQAKHLNELLQAFGKAKALLSDERFVKPNYALMSNTFNDEMTNAEQFTASGKRVDSKMNASGDLETVKDIACYATNAPAIHLGDQRAIIGVKGTLQYVIAKPFNLSPAQERRDENGQLNGGQEAYGEEYSAIHCPVPIRNQFISVLSFSEAARAAMLVA